MDSGSPLHSEPVASRASAVESVLPSRLLPRISFRAMMILTAVSAVVIAIVNLAGQGGVYARAVSVGLAYVCATFLFLSFLFLALWSISQIPRFIAGGLLVGAVGLFLLQVIGLGESQLGFFARPVWVINFLAVGCCLLIMPIGRQKEDSNTSPFAADQLPPQIMAPREPKL